MFIDLPFCKYVCPVFFLLKFGLYLRDLYNLYNRNTSLSVVSRQFVFLYSEKYNLNVDK